jgi:protein-L-isoaspartate(D-aspartate) O-methyltransferase
MADYATRAKQSMIDGQLAPNQITDVKLLEAIRRTPREPFVPSAFSGTAYVDEEIPLGVGRMLMEPLVLARLIQSLALTGHERVLIIGGALGYSAALLSLLCAGVTMVESEAGWLTQARQALASLKRNNVTLLHSELQAPALTSTGFDALLIEGAIVQIPSALACVIRQGGRMAYVKNRALRQGGVAGSRGGLGTLISAVREQDQRIERALGEAGVALLPGFEAPNVFSFS